MIHLAAQAGVRYSLDHPHSLYQLEPHRLPACARGLPPPRRRASRLCLVELGLRRQPQAALRRERSRRSSGEPLWCDQEGERADGAFLCPSVRAAGDGLALFHRVRSVGAARHVALPVHPQDPRRRADRGLQLRPSRPRFHLYRRRGRRRACARFDKVATPDPAWNPEAPDPATSSAPYRLYNIGNNSPVALLDYIAAIEKALGRKAKIELLPQQPGDVEETYADVEALKAGDRVPARDAARPAASSASSPGIATTTGFDGCLPANAELRLEVDKARARAMICSRRPVTCNASQHLPAGDKAQTSKAFGLHQPRQGRREEGAGDRRLASRSAGSNAGSRRAT